METVGIITNLNARKNRFWSMLERPKPRWEMDGVLTKITRDISEIDPAIEDFLENRCKYWVADGGDGTMHWLINQAREVLIRKGQWRGEDSLPFFVPTNGGTIDFVANKSKIKGNSDQVIRRLLEGIKVGKRFETVKIDTLEVLGHRPSEPKHIFSFRKVGFAIAVGGIGQRFFQKYYSAKNPNKWTIIEVCLKTATGIIAQLPIINMIHMGKELREYAQEILSGTLADVTVDGKHFGVARWQGLHAASVDIDFGTVKLFKYAKEPGKMHFVVGTIAPIEASYKWMYMVFGKPIPADTWYEFPGERMEVEAKGNELLSPVIDGEIYYGLDKVIVQRGPNIRVPAI